MVHTISTICKPITLTKMATPDEQSIQAQIDYIKSKGLGGAMTWEVTGDRNKTLQMIVKQGLLP